MLRRVARVKPDQDHGDGMEEADQELKNLLHHLNLPGAVGIRPRRAAADFLGQVDTADGALLSWAAGDRGLFGQMGFEEVLRDLEARRDRGATLSELTGAVPEQMLQAVGYYGPAAAAPAAFARLSTGLDEAIVRVVAARPGLEPVIAAMAALSARAHPGRLSQRRLSQRRPPASRANGLAIQLK